MAYLGQGQRKRDVSALSNDSVLLKPDGDVAKKDRYVSRRQHSTEYSVALNGRVIGKNRRAPRRRPRCVNAGFSLTLGAQSEDVAVKAAVPHMEEVFQLAGPLPAVCSIVCADLSFDPFVS